MSITSPATTANVSFSAIGALFMISKSTTLKTKSLMPE